MLDIIGMGRPVKDLLVAVDEVPEGDEACLAKELSSSSGSATFIFGRLVIGSPPYKLRSFLR